MSFVLKLLIVLAILISLGSVFHNRGAYTEKARSPTVRIAVLGTTNKSLFADRSVSRIIVHQETSDVIWSLVIDGTTPGDISRGISR